MQGSLARIYLSSGGMFNYVRLSPGDEAGVEAITLYKTMPTLLFGNQAQVSLCVICMPHVPMPGRPTSTRAVSEGPDFPGFRSRMERAGAENRHMARGQRRCEVHWLLRVQWAAASWIAAHNPMRRVTAA